MTYECPAEGATATDDDDILLVPLSNIWCTFFPGKFQTHPLHQIFQLTNFRTKQKKLPV